MYVYRLKNGHELCRSGSKVTFGEGFPQFSEIEPEVIEKPAAKKKAAIVKPKEGDK